MSETPPVPPDFSAPTKVSALLLPAAERERILVEWNQTKTAYPTDQCAHWLFEEVVRNTPHALAVEMDGASLTYRELNDRADILAAHLRELGVGPDVLVGHCTERSLDLVVGILGILKAGGAYVPIDPAYPADRIAHVLADAKAAAIVTQRALVPHLPATAAKLVVMDEPLPASKESLPAIAGLSSAHLAYVIYTSGSTGKPKGVQISHRALVNFLNAMRKSPGLRPDDVMLALTTISFDIAGLELHLPLTTGAKIVIASRQSVIDGSALIGLVERHGVTVMQATPATWRLMLESDWTGRSGLRILCGGEPLPRDLAQKLLPLCAELWNMYGPTETTIWSTCAQITEADSITIGRPIDNTDLYILDENLQPVPIGAEGELMIGGDGLARGYNGLPELTAEKFISHPFKPGQRLYRTGDLARYRPDGRVDCLGRIDFQVKIRGYRIELGEIESILSKHPSVNQAVVNAWAESSGEKRLVAYLVPNGITEPPLDEIRQVLRAALPEYMIPAVFVTLPRLPLTPNGKIDRKALPLPGASAVPAPRPSAAPLRGELERTIAGVWQEFLSVQHVGATDNFFDLGGHSLILGRIHARLRKILQRDLTIVELFQHPTIQSLVEYLTADRTTARAERPRMGPQSQAGEAVAIVGMAGRFPGAKNLAEFWRNLREGVESISVLSDAELTAAGVPIALAENPHYVRARPKLANAEYFDAHLFGYSPREATITDPQQRVFLEVAWEALENAGYDPEQYPSPIGVYAGGSPNVYVFHLMAKLGTGPGSYGFPLTVSNEKDYLATRVSYELNLKGPSVTIQTACSTSLVAVHMACRSLLGGECTVALAGAVSVNVPQEAGYLYQEGGIVSPDGHCRVFDAGAGGTVFGNGLGIVVLKRLSEAIADGDTIHAVIKGTAINNDGSGKVGFTAPSVDGQAEVIEMAHAAAGLTADTISYVEAHGTGTVLGDPIEIAGLTQAFRASTDRSGFCALGSVKTNIGHLDAAAGMAGLLKTVLALQHRELPPTLHFQQPNPKINFANSPFVVNAALSPWTGSGAPLRAGVSCFGVGGTNSHVVVEEAPAPAHSDPARPRELLVFSAKTKTALEQALKNFAGYLTEFPAVNLGDAAFTLQVGRRALEYRCALVCENREQAIRILESKDGLIQSTTVAGRPQVVFMFSGQGAQYSGMAAELYRSEPFFARTIDECLEMAKPHLSMDLRPILFGDAAAGTVDINQTALAQPALFIIEYAMARLWMSWGITPEAMIGHSIGEYAAACLAGVLSLKDAIELVAVRGRLMQQLPAGSMLAVPLNEAAMAEVLKIADPTGRISIAALNAPGSCVVSGPTDALEKLEAYLTAQGTAARKLHTSHAFHSSMMDPVLAEFTAIVSRVKLNPPQLPYVSNLTGTWIRPEEATDPRYYARHLRQAVRFSAGIQELVREPDRIFLEVGPGQTLTTLTRRHLHNGRLPLALPSLRPANDAQSDVGFLLNTVGRLWLSGAHIAWAGFTRGVARRRIPLPTYPFEHQRYTVHMAPAIVGATEEAPAAPFVHARPEVQTDYVAPQTEREKALARVWQRCLGIDRIGLHDNFFELGGDSLLAGQVVTEIRNEVHVTLQLIDFFAAPTIALLNPLLDAAVVDLALAAPVERREARRDLAGQRLRRQQARPTLE